jgi:hypothetical protein
MKEVFDIFLLPSFTTAKHHVFGNERYKIDFGFNAIVDREKGGENGAGLRSADQFGERTISDTRHTDDFHYGGGRSDMKPRDFGCQPFTDPKRMGRNDSLVGGMNGQRQGQQA